MPLLACPEVNSLRRFLHGLLTETEASAVESHLSLCCDCQAQIDTLGHGSDSFISDLIRVAASPNPQHVGANNTHNDQNGDLTGTSDRRRSNAAIPDPLRGQRVIRDYQIIDCIGQGGMGCVYRAIHQHLNKIVALKILQADRAGSPEAILRFAREKQVLANLVHPCIVQAFDGGEHDGMPYFVMEFIDGVDLQKLIRNIGPLPVPEACQIIRKAAGALQYAHEQQVIHRDVKPSNLMVTTSGSVKLLDLGLAQIFGAATEDAISRTGQIVGTLNYMAPEQITGGHPVNQRSDIFSLGVTFYELLIGSRPYEGLSNSFVDLLDARPDIPPDLLKLLFEMIALHAPDRPASMTEVEERLGASCPEVNLMTFVSRYFRGAESRVSPPVQISGAGHFSSGNPSGRSQVEATSPPSSGQRKRPAIINRSAMAAALGGALLATSAWFVFSGSQVDSIPIPPPPRVELATVQFAPDPLTLQWMSRKKVTAFNLKTGVAVSVEPQMELPVGSYEVRFLSPPVKLLHDRTPFDVLQGDANIVDIHFVPSTPFMVPDLPSEVGAFARYYGSIEREGHDEIAYDLYMTLLAEDREANMVIAKWFEIEAITKHPDGDFKETAYIKLDMDKWTTGTFQVNEGWVIVGGPAIENFRLKHHPRSPAKQCIVEFSMERDELLKMSQDTLLPLPEHRVSIQDYIALFFGDDKSANANDVAVLRAKLGAYPATHSIDESQFDPTLQACYCVSSRSDYKLVNSTGYSMVRRTSDRLNPFGFLFLDVNLTGFKAHCKLRLGGSREFNPLQKKRELDQMRHDLSEQLKERWPIVANRHPDILDTEPNPQASPEKSPATSQAEVTNLPNTSALVEDSVLPSVKSLGVFDIAWLPEEPSSIRYIGTIKRGDLSENVQFNVKLLSYQQIENGGQGAWIEVEVNSTKENSASWEAIRVLIDADAYRNSEKFIIKEGWVAFGKPEFVYVFPQDGDLETLVDKRLQHHAYEGEELHTGSIGVVDALYMLFKVELQPATKISSLRSSLPGKIFANPKQSRVSEPASYMHKSGPINCSRTSSSVYDFYRTSEIPFGFVFVSLEAYGVDIKLEIDTRGDTLTSFESKFGTLENIATLNQEHQKRLSGLNRPNWRVWSWRDTRLNYKAWAEFGGTFEVDGKRYLLLSDEAKNQIRIPVNMLLQSSRTWMDQGRFWETFGNRQLVILNRDATRKQIEFMETKAPNKKFTHGRPSNGTPLFEKESDNEWFNRLLAAEKRKVSTEQMTNDWQSFAGYKRAK